MQVYGVHVQMDTVHRGLSASIEVHVQMDTRLRGLSASIEVHYTYTQGLNASVRCSPV